MNPETVQWVYILECVCVVSLKGLGSSDLHKIG